MTYDKDANRNPRRSYPMTDETNYTGWVIGGIATFALIFGLFLMFGRDDRLPTAANNVNRPAVTSPTTTGSGSGSVDLRGDPVRPALRAPTGNGPVDLRGDSVPPKSAGNMPSAPGASSNALPEKETPLQE